MANPFDQFDQVASTGNPFDKFDAAPAEVMTPKRNWSDIPGEALSNLPKSAGSFVSGIAQAVMNPLDTAGNLLDIGAGSLRNVLPASVSSAIDRFDPGAQAASNQARMSGKADATGAFFKDRYGSIDGLKNTLATDPVGAAADASTILTGGAALAGKVGLTGTAGALRTGARLTNPTSLVGAAVRKAGPMIGNGVANVIGGLGTHTGAETIKQAFRSGRAGGDSARSLADNMRGNVPMTDVLDAAKSNLHAMGEAKSQAYRQGMAQVSGDTTVLNFSGIDKALNDAGKVATFKGQVTNTKAAATYQAIRDAVDDWKSLDPAEFHTPEGLDALKKKIGGIVDSVPFEEKTANLVGNKIYNAVKSEIVKQAPVYADTMKGYTQASDQIREIERAMSLGSKASVDTAMRKLQSLTRNNVNTNYGNRLKLGAELEQQGGRSLMPALAGQALSSWTPRGLGGVAAGGLGMGGYALGGMAAAVPALAVQSPRLMGEMALATGRVAGAADKAARPIVRGAQLMDGIGLPPADFLNYMYQVGRLPQE